MGDLLKLPKRKPRPMLERDVQREIREALGRLDGVVVWRNNTGMLKDSRGISVRYGLAIGSSDLIGIVYLPQLGIGRFFALEIKRPGEEPSDEQYAFLHLIRKIGGFSTWVDNVDAAVSAVGRARDPRWDR